MCILVGGWVNPQAIMQLVLQRVRLQFKQVQTVYIQSGTPLNMSRCWDWSRRRDPMAALSAGPPPMCRCGRRPHRIIENRRSSREEYREWENRTRILHTHTHKMYVYVGWCVGEQAREHAALPTRSPSTIQTGTYMY